MERKKDRTILHCDMNGFYASVELLDYPQYKNIPMAVCGDPKSRHGIILAKNEPAKKFGIKTAETIWQAKKKCPSLVCVPPHHDKYSKYSKMINEIYLRYTDMVEPFSIDESWLDVSASLTLFGSGKEIADQIREIVKKELGLTLSAGVSFNKIFAKMGSEYKKPDATTVITRENYKNIIWPMDISEMFFVGKATADKLKTAGIHTIGDLANTSRPLLVSMLGKHGGMLYDYSNGLDEEPVSLYSDREKIKSVGHGMTFTRNITGSEDIKAALSGLCDKVASRLRRNKMRAWGVKVDIKDPDFNVVSKQKQLDAAINTAEDISIASYELITSFWPLDRPIRLLTVTAINLVDENEDQQLSFFDTENTQRRQRAESVERTLDMIRDKYGSSSIGFGRTVNNDIGIKYKEPNKNNDDD